MKLQKRLNKGKVSLLMLLVVVLMLSSGCGSGSPSKQTVSQSNAKSVSAPKSEPVFKIGGIPDQDVSVLTRRFGGVAKYLSEKTGLHVEYVPTQSYAALVTAFQRGDIQLAWFGGLTGVQARSGVPGSEAIAQRPTDNQFHSVFIVQKKLTNVNSLKDLKGLSFTFGSESSTSGHLMPRYSLMQAGIDPEKDFNGKPNYSGSHDKTWKLVESGAYQAGALNQVVWDERVKQGKVDLSKVKVIYTTPPFYDYNWSINNVDSVYGKGTKEKVTKALLSMTVADQNDVLQYFQAKKFVATNNSNYTAIEKVAKKLGIIK